MFKSKYIFVMLALVVLSAIDLNAKMASLLFLCIAGVLILAYRPQRINVTAVGLVALAYSGYMLSMLLPDLNNTCPLPQYDLDKGMTWVVRGFGAFALAYVITEQYLARKKAGLSIDETVVAAHSDYAIYFIKSIAWLAIGARLLSMMLSGGTELTFIEYYQERSLIESTVSQVLKFLGGLNYPFFVCFMIIYLTNRKNISRSLWFLFLALLAISALEIVTIGTKSTIISLMLVFLLAMTFFHRRFYAKKVFVGALAVMVTYGTFSIITEYRAIMYENLGAGMDVFNISVQAKAFSNALSSGLAFSDTSTKRLAYIDNTTILSRLGSGMFSLANLFYFTGGQSPYENAWESFLIPLYAVSPRALLPEKPEFFGSGHYAKQYFGWSYGGISVSLLGSFYYAWGYTGIILGMAFMGAIFAHLANEFYRNGIFSPHQLILFVTLFLGMMDCWDNLPGHIYKPDSFIVTNIFTEVDLPDEKTDPLINGAAFYKC